MHNIYICIISFRYGENKYEPIIHHLSSAIGATTQLWPLVTTGYFSLYIYVYGIYITIIMAKWGELLNC